MDDKYNPPGYTPTEKEFQKFYPDYLKMWQVEEWEEHYPYEVYKVDMLRHLNEPHCGDCTRAAATCDRCMSEQLFEIPLTVTWRPGFRYASKQRRFVKINTAVARTD